MKQCLPVLRRRYLGKIRTLRIIWDVSYSSSSRHQMTKMHQNPNFDTASRTRIYCFLSLLIGVTLALLCLSSGLYIIATEPKTLGLPLDISPLTQELVILIVNVTLTLCIDGMMFTHSVSLRWALHHENGLQFNTNIRLLTSSSRSGPNRWYSNAATLFFLVLSYGSSSTLLPQTLTTPLLNATSLIGLGMALAGQAVIAAWCLLSNRRLIPTWSSNPLNATLAAIKMGTITRRPGRSLLSVHHQKHKLLPEPVCPAKRQRPMIIAHRAVPYIVIIVWSLAFLATAWVISIVLVSRTISPTCWNFTMMWNIGGYCFYNSAEFRFGSSDTYGPLYTYGQYTILCLLFVCAIQGLQTIGLHCVELLVNMSRDEAVWRRAYSETEKQAPGLQLTQSPLVAAVTSWENVILLFAKAVSHWALSQAMLPVFFPWDMKTVSIVFVYSRLALYALLAILLALFTTYLALRRPSGCQPTTLGHLQTIADLVDDWETDDHGRMWWGEKTWSSEQIRHAGTSCHRRLLSRIDVEAKYF
ncbi:hypothetical protein L249_3956 [Ophiocordyceps polyrhachis-furcata BCC 54312]|uniref:Uncharacterized protein n=1 Tax=Ophiocordyceps polyrhachis-furcata BCC 54312 TaxID=1330021 RepID=A0A367L5L8_9HYPO|nr:hypothetical protein L249_3956 [Ophiocordyceps polyrhachis-furcata BCC 54312]